MTIAPDLQALLDREPSSRVGVAVFFKSAPSPERLAELGLPEFAAQPAIGMLDAAQIYRLDALDEVESIERLPQNRPS